MEAKDNSIMHSLMEVTSRSKEIPSANNLLNGTKPSDELTRAVDLVWDQLVELGVTEMPHETYWSYFGPTTWAVTILGIGVSQLVHKAEAAYPAHAGEVTAVPNSWHALLSTKPAPNPTTQLCRDYLLDHMDPYINENFPNGRISKTNLVQHLAQLEVVDGCASDQLEHCRLALKGVTPVWSNKKQADESLLDTGLSDPLPEPEQVSKQKKDPKRPTIQLLGKKKEENEPKKTGKGGLSGFGINVTDHSVERYFPRYMGKEEE